MGSFLNPDTTRIIAKRIILTGHPFKVHKKTATVRYMFFNSGMYPQLLLSSGLLTLFGHRRHQLLQTHPIAYKIWTDGSYPRVPRYTWVFQGTFRWSYQPDGYCLYVTLQTRIPQMERELERGTRSSCRYYGGISITSLSRNFLYPYLVACFLCFS